MRGPVKKAHFLQYTTLGVCCALSLNCTNAHFFAAVRPHVAQASQSRLQGESLCPRVLGTSLPMSDQLWAYLRAGLNYLETSGNALPPGYRHPGNVAYGALGLTESAVQDVKQKYALARRYSSGEVFSSDDVYDAFARLYADLLLRHYLGMRYETMPATQVFACLQKAWFLGPTQYRQGAQVLSCRQRKSDAFISRIAFPLDIHSRMLLARLP